MIIVLIGQGTLKPHQNAEETNRKQSGSIMYIDSNSGIILVVVSYSYNGQK